MKLLARFVPVPILAIAFACGTWLLGWWAVPVLALVAGAVLASRSLPGLTAALAGMLAWGGLLAIQSLTGVDVMSWAVRVGAAMQLPGAVLLVATVLWPGILAGLAAYVGATVAREVSMSRRRASVGG